MSLKINTQKEPLKVIQFFHIYKYLYVFTNAGAVSRHYESCRREYLDTEKLLGRPTLRTQNFEAGIDKYAIIVVY